MRDPTDRFDLPDHLTWQMNLAVDYRDLDQSVARGILGGTLVPTVDSNGALIMQGMDSIRGTQETVSDKLLQYAYISRKNKCLGAHRRIVNKVSSILY